MPQIELSKINEVLSNLSNIVSRYKKVSDTKSDNYFQEKQMGETGENTSILDVGLDPLYVKVVKYIDSYGSTEYVHSVQFVKATQKTVTVYEPATT